MSRPSGARQQLALQFPRLDPAGRPLIETGPYAPALSALRRWRGWPDGRLALVGEAGSGRTRLLQHWAAETGAAYATGAALAAADIDGIAALTVSALAVDDADQSERGAGLLAAINMCGRRGAPILLAGRAPPTAWADDPPDLQSRLRSMPVATIGPPDEPTLMLRLREACLQRHLKLPEDVYADLAGRLPLNWLTIDRAADAIEAVPARAFTLRNVRAALSGTGIPVD
jgi:chromosomal replication initiation ATPase DnaA